MTANARAIDRDRRRESRVGGRLRRPTRRSPLLKAVRGARVNPRTCSISDMRGGRDSMTRSISRCRPRWCSDHVEHPRDTPGRRVPPVSRCVPDGGAERRTKVAPRPSFAVAFVPPARRSAGLRRSHPAIGKVLMGAGSGGFTFSGGGATLAGAAALSACARGPRPSGDRARSHGLQARLSPTERTSRSPRRSLARAPSPLGQAPRSNRQGGVGTPRTPRRGPWWPRSWRSCT